MAKVLTGFVFLLVLTFSLSLPAQLTAAEDSVRTLSRVIVEGLQPLPEAGARLAELKHDFLEYVENYGPLKKKTRRAARSDVAPSCQQFLALFEDVHRQGVDLITDLNSTEVQGDSRALRRARLWIFQSLAKAMTLFIVQGSEAGAGTLETLQTKQCEFQNRETWKTRALELNTRMNRAIVATIGICGLRQMGEIEQELGMLIYKKEGSDRRKYWWSMGAGTALSVMVWSLAPVAVALTLGPLSRLSQGLPLFAVRSFGIAGEMILFRYADHFLFAEDQILADRRPLITWVDFMTSATQLLQAELNSPRLYDEILANLFGDISHKAMEVITGLGGLTRLPRATIADLEVRSANMAQSVGNRIQNLRRDLQQRFKVHAECNHSWISGISEQQCLVGLRSLHRQINHFNLSQQIPVEFTEFKIGSDWRTRFVEDRLQVTIPSHASTEALDRYGRYLASTQLNSREWPM